MKKEFTVSEIIYGVTGYRTLSGENLDYFEEGDILTDLETVGVDKQYYVEYGGLTILSGVSEHVVSEFFSSGKYKNYIK